jgi:hypothetical protein
MNGQEDWQLEKLAKPWYWTDLVKKVSDEFLPPSVITDDIMPQPGAKTKWCSIHKKCCKRTGIGVSDWRLRSTCVAIRSSIGFEILKMQVTVLVTAGMETISTKSSC